MATELFKVMAGVSADTFSIGGVAFYAAPLTLMEYGAFLALPENQLDSKAEFLADKLQRRIVGTKVKPDTITQEWLLENLTVPVLTVLQHVLLYGEMPKESAEPKKP